MKEERAGSDDDFEEVIRLRDMAAPGEVTIIFTRFTPDRLYVRPYVQN